MSSSVSIICGVVRTDWPRFELIVNKSDADLTIFGDLEIKVGIMYQAQTKLNQKWCLKINVS